MKKLQATLPPEKVAKAYVGGGTEYDEQNIGWIEEEAIRRHVALNMASVVDIGCGIGRLTRLLLDCNLKAYLGIDILDPILYEAKKVAKDHAHFTFANVRNFKVPRLDGSVDVVCGFSLITHLLDEQAYLYFAETARVLKPGGLALFSFVDFNHPRHWGLFREYCKTEHTGMDLLKFFEKQTLERFGAELGMPVIEFIDGGTPFDKSGVREKYPDGRPLPAKVTNGQSMCYMRKSN